MIEDFDSSNHGTNEEENLYFSFALTNREFTLIVDNSKLLGFQQLDIKPKKELKKYGIQLSLLLQPQQINKQEILLKHLDEERVELQKRPQRLSGMRKSKTKRVDWRRVKKEEVTTSKENKR